MKDRENRRKIRGTEWTGVKEIDAAERTHRIRIWMRALPGGVVGFIAGLAFGGPLGALVGAILGVVFVAGIAFVASQSGGWLFARIHNPSGGGTTRNREYSRVDALVARARYQDALDELEARVLEDPLDPIPYLRIARILRDHLASHQESVRWFRRARAEARLTEGEEITVGRELVDLYQVRLDDPRRAAPELARLAERFAGASTGEWAERELAAVKERMRKEDEDAPDPRAP